MAVTTYKCTQKLLLHMLFVVGFSCCANISGRPNLQDGSCRVALGSSGSGDEVTAPPDELEIIRPRKGDRVKIMNGTMRGVVGKLIGVDGSDGIVRAEGSLEVKIVDLVILGKLAP